eukprot:gnl/TRDRNA2_/TRDRNA2_160423_c2_seq1.p1 gnl/TRDRNA2_/TRDRNA2_160423_c2~~gnl/TRDRNA2_/TRDRNA2_160423_c2_seq1.p1  ORF type:complete len:285 (+),score=55.98 gnl/TRDRNA2_/TRDRNA2_160423_c2_seq1:33-857(+)
MAHPDDADDEHFVDKIEELEDDAGGMMLAFLTTVMLRYIIAGNYGQDLGEHTPPKLLHHTPLQRGILLAYALVMCLAAFFLLPKLNRLGERLNGPQGGSLAGYFLQRMVLLLNPFLTMSAAWALLLWADWEFYENVFRHHQVFARIVVGFWFAFVCFGAIWIYGIVAKREQHHDRSHPDQLRRASSRALDLAWRWSDLERRKFILNAAALVIAFPWEGALDTSVDVAVAGKAHPWPLKALMAVVLTGIFVPLYLYLIHDEAANAEKQEDITLGF